MDRELKQQLVAFVTTFCAGIAYAAQKSLKRVLAVIRPTKYATDLGGRLSKEMIAQITEDRAESFDRRPLVADAALKAINGIDQARIVRALRVKPSVVVLALQWAQKSFPSVIVHAPIPTIGHQAYQTIYAAALEADKANLPPGVYAANRALVQIAIDKATIFRGRKKRRRKR